MVLCQIPVLRMFFGRGCEEYFVYFLLDETVFICCVYEICGECVEAFVKEIISWENSSFYQCHAGLEIATDTVTNATNIFSLALKQFT